MTIIKRIEINNIEKSLNDVIEASYKLMMFQEQMKFVNSQLENNRKFFNSGLISKETYEGNQRNFKIEIDDLKRNINSTITDTTKVVNDVETLIKINKI